jgi:hypothetical protein
VYRVILFITSFSLSLFVFCVCDLLLSKKKSAIQTFLLPVSVFFLFLLKTCALHREEQHKATAFEAVVEVGWEVITLHFRNAEAHTRTHTHTHAGTIVRFRLSVKEDEQASIDALLLSFFFVAVMCCTCQLSFHCCVYICLFVCEFVCTCVQVFFLERRLLSLFPFSSLSYRCNGGVWGPVCICVCVCVCQCVCVQGILPLL